MTDTPAVRNNPALSRFELDTKAGMAVVNYRAAPGVLTFYHTEVPPQLTPAALPDTLFPGLVVTIQPGERGSSMTSLAGGMSTSIPSSSKYMSAWRLAEIRSAGSLASSARCRTARSSMNPMTGR